MPFPSLAAAGDAVEGDLVQLGIDWLHRSGLEPKNGWGIDERIGRWPRYSTSAELVAAEVVARRWPDGR